MTTFRSKPTTIEAEQFLDTNNPPPGVQQQDWIFYVVTIQGERVPVHVGEWIIKEPTGDGYYPCADEVFQKRWEPVRVRPYGLSRAAGVVEGRTVVFGIDPASGPDASAVVAVDPHTGRVWSGPEFGTG